MSAPGEERLAAENRRLLQENEALRTQLQELEIIRRNLEHTVAVYQRCLFGSRSEKIDSKELEARIAQAAAEAREQLAKEKRSGDPPPEAEEEQPEENAHPPADQPADPEKEKKRKARPHGRGGFPAHLPRRRIEHPVDPAQALCACCSDHPPLIQVGEDIRRGLFEAGADAPMAVDLVLAAIQKLYRIESRDTGPAMSLRAGHRRAGKG